MRYLTPLALLAFSALVGACEKNPNGPESEVYQLDTVQTRGTLLTSGESMFIGGPLVWVPGTELVAFASRPDTGGCAIKTMDAANGSTGVVDGDCVNLSSFWEPYFRTLVAAPDGSGLYYTVGIDEVGSSDPEFPLRVADLLGGGTSTLRSVRWQAALAMSPDGQHLAFMASDSLFVRNLSSEVETHYADLEWGGPIVFSPDGTELLYRKGYLPLFILRRLALGDGTSEPVSLPYAWRHARLFHWGATGIEVLAEGYYPPEYHVHNLTTGESVQVGSVQRGEGVPNEQFIPKYQAWSIDGTRVAYWSLTCFDCAGSPVEYYRALFVADTRTGTRDRVAYTTAGSGPTVFSPDGTRLVYYTSSSDGMFYVVEVP